MSKNLGEHHPRIPLVEQLHHTGRKFTYRVDRLRLPNGIEGDYAYIEHPGAGLAIPVTADGRFVLVKQYRFAIQRYILEFPAGTLEKDEQPEITIRRELEEETGYRAHSWKKLGAFYICPGYSDEVIHTFLAQDLEKLECPPSQDADEDIEVVLLDKKAIEHLIESSDDVMAIDAKSIGGFYTALRYL